LGLFSGKKPAPAPVAPKGRAKKRSSLATKLFLVWPLYIAVGGGAALGTMQVRNQVLYSDPLTMRTHAREPSIRVLARDGSLIGERGGVDDYVPLDLMPRTMVNAVIATEDKRFFEHHGIDPLGLLRAAIANARAGHFVQGGSTLTQQLAKNLYLSSDRTFARKLQEFSLALWLESRLSKSDILELYLNRMYLGGGAYGVDAAARRYFGKPARNLMLAEAALVAGLLKAPSKYSPVSNAEYARSRGRIVLAQMRSAGFITAEEEREAGAQMAGMPQASRTPDAGAEYAVDYVLDALPPEARSGGEDIVVETTLDKPLQVRASEILSRNIAARGAELQASQAALIVLGTDGAIRALVGGRSYQESQFDRAVRARRQPGSAFKPFVYLAALEAGYTPDSMVEDLPVSVSGWAPRNDNGEYQGTMTMRAALSRSVNAVAVRLALKLGPARVAAAARRLGIQSPLRTDASLALGTSEVTLLELAGAYDVFANGGRAVEPYVLRRVVTRSGMVLYTHQPQPPVQAVAPAQVAAMTDMLNATLTSGTGRRAALPYAAAAKTGTSQGFRDAWFVGYSADVTTGVWVGNDDGTAMNRVVGGSLPADIWHEVMLAAHQGREPPPLQGVVTSSLPQAAAPLPPGAAMHPQEAIGDDFIARALQGSEAPAEETGSRAELREPPDGRMSLGRFAD
jgi:penicillin-binding protein 1A